MQPAEDLYSAKDLVEVLVPASGSDLCEAVAPGSGMVGSLVGETDRLRVDFEGDEQLFPRFADRVRRAAERHQWEGPSGMGYPTSACAYVDASEVQSVGEFHPSSGQVVVTNQSALEAWLGVDEVPLEELIAS